MSEDNAASSPFIGIIGFGAFGRLTALYLRPHFRLCAFDPALQPGSVAEMPDITLTSLAVAAGRPVVILATPVNRLDEMVSAIAPHLRPGALVLGASMNGSQINGVENLVAIEKAKISCLKWSKASHSTKVWRSSCKPSPPPDSFCRPKSRIPRREFSHADIAFVDQRWDW